MRDRRQWIIAPRTDQKSNIFSFAVLQLYALLKKQWKEHNFPYVQKRLNACPNVNESEAEQEIGPAQQNWIAAVQLFSPKLYTKKWKLLEKQVYQHREINVSVHLNSFLLYVSLTKRHNCHIYLLHKILFNDQEIQTVFSVKSEWALF